MVTTGTVETVPTYGQYSKYDYYRVRGNADPVEQKTTTT